jgi:membrane protease YdiL (CAAX protease family)
MKARSRATEDRRVGEAALFYALALGLATLAAAAVALTGIAPIVGLYMFSPLIAVLILHVLRGSGGWRALWRDLGADRLGLRGWPFAVLVPAALLIAVSLAVFATGVGHFAPPADAPPLPLWAMAVFVHLLVGAVFAFGEEAGWRGYLLPRLTGLGLAPAMALSGLLHGLWHLPVILLTPLYHADGSRWIVVPEFLLLLTLAGFVYGYLRLVTGSLWPVVLLHASFNETLAQTASVTRTADPALLEYLGAESGLLTIAGTALVVLWIRLRPPLGPIRA